MAACGLRTGALGALDELHARGLALPMDQAEHDEGSSEKRERGWLRKENFLGWWVDGQARNRVNRQGGYE